MTEEVQQDTMVTDLSTTPTHAGNIHVGSSGGERRVGKNRRKTRAGGRRSSDAQGEEGASTAGEGGEGVGQETRSFSTSQRKTDAKTGVALPDGSFPIPDKDALRRAIDSFGRAKNKSAAKAHIIKRARALGAASMLPEGWMNQEKMLTTTLLLEGMVPKVQIVQESASDGNGVMRIRVPFYVAGSIAQAPGFETRLYWRGGQHLDTLIQEGNDEIHSGKQPLTVYARHAHANDGTHLPVGKIVGLERQDRIGYSIIDVIGKGDGAVIQDLVRNRMLNAVSLRTSRYDLEPVQIDGEEMFAPAIRLDGIDFAPDNPAMPTHGIEVLAAEAKVIPRNTENDNEEEIVEVPKLTLEAVKADARIVAEIEAPLREKLSKLEKTEKDLTSERDEAKKLVTALEQEVSGFKEKESARERAEYLALISSKLPEPEKAKAILEEMCKDAKSKDEIATIAMPILLEGISKAKPAEPVKAPKDALLELFQPGGSGRVDIEQETRKKGVEYVDGLPVPN